MEQFAQIAGFQSEDWSQMKMIVKRWSIFCLLLLAAMIIPFVNHTQAVAADERAVIEKLMRDTWDKPEAQLDVGPVVVSADYAVAGWMQGQMGGRALLHRRAGQWTVILCAGDALLSAAALQQVDLPATAASSLATQVRSAEAGIATERVAKFNAFQGIVQMDNHSSAKH